MKMLFLAVKLAQMQKVQMIYRSHLSRSCPYHTLLKLSRSRVGTSIVQSVNSRGKCRKLPARQILQKSLRWHILAFMNKTKLKTCKIKTYYLYLQKMTFESITYLNKYSHLHIYSVYFEMRKMIWSYQMLLKLSRHTGDNNVIIQCPMS